MTYEPGRDPQNPLDVDPKTRQYRTETPVGGVPAQPRSGMWMVGVLALLAAAGIIWYGMSDRSNVANNEMPAATGPATTTGTGNSPSTIIPAEPGDAATNPPAANPPATPPAPRE